jgi:hypothetical protein
MGLDTSPKHGSATELTGNAAEELNVIRLMVLLAARGRFPDSLARWSMLAPCQTGALRAMRESPTSNGFISMRYKNTALTALVYDAFQ